MKTDSSVINVRAFQTVALATRSSATRPSIFLPRASFGLCPSRAPPPPRLPYPVFWNHAPTLSDCWRHSPPGMTSHLNWRVAEWASKWLRPATIQRHFLLCHQPPFSYSQSQYCPSRYWTRWRLNDSHTKYDNGAKISRLVSRDATLLPMITF